MSWTREFKVGLTGIIAVAFAIVFSLATDDRPLGAGEGYTLYANFPSAEGVYVSTPGYMLTEASVPDGAVLMSVDGQEVPDLEALEAVLSSLPDRARVPLRYFPISDPRQDQVAVLTIDRTWHPMQVCVRDDSDGTWPCVASPEPPEAEAVEAEAPAADAAEADKALELLAELGEQAQVIGSIKELSPGSEQVEYLRL